MRHEFEWVSGGEYARESAKATGLHNSSENCISGKKPHALPKIWFRADACDMRISLPHSSTFIPLRFILWISIQPHNTLKLCPLKTLEKNWETAGTVTQQWLYENVLSGVFWLFLFIKTSKYFIIFLSININKGLLTVITWKSFGLTSLPCLWRPGSSAAASLPTSLLCDHAHKSRKRRGNINNQHQSFSFTVCS